MQNRRKDNAGDSIMMALHPGTVATPLTRPWLCRHPSVTPDEAAARLTAVLAGLTPAQTGGFHDYAGREISW